MQKNEVCEIEITGMTAEGDGVGRIDNMAVFVPYCIVGERVRIIIVKVLKNYAYGKLLEVLRPSLHRRKAECPYFYKCGGCQLWHMDMEEELRLKRQNVTDCLTRIGRLSIEAETPENPSEEVRYRNKAQFPVTPEGIGFYRRNSHSVIPVEDCLIQGEWNRDVVAAVKEWMKENGISPYDETTDSGDIRHIYTRKGDSGVLLTIVTRTKKLPHEKELVTKLQGLDTELAGIVQNVNDRPTNVVLGCENRVVRGSGYLVDSIGKVRFKISPMSFYQVNKKATIRLYETAEELANLKGNEVLWDVYCGIGTIGLFMADKAKKIVGIEIVKEAVENARENALLNGVENVEYFCGKAEEMAPKLVAMGNKPDVAVLDPPRKGCDERLMKAIIAAKPKRIVYVSCKPSTLARDLKYFEANGYKTERVVPVNMFPRSAHIETVCLLTRKR